MTLEEIQTRIGDLSVAALRQGGEELLDRVEGRLSVAIRHCDRIQAGTLPFVPAIEEEMIRSLNFATELLEAP